ncbi:unnamed protein product [Ambrosiozyma monospora]|uniref:Unnamed protein product n=1 Tax=Ambrosiozyma monospora TaxID=43982 RepID=A0A9W7DIM5_AMBMO|nr:unnamed protein product [Ambrosiozyma monospora]
MLFQQNLALILSIQLAFSLAIPLKTGDSTVYITSEVTVTKSHHVSSIRSSSQSESSFLPLTTSYPDSQALHWASFAALEYIISGLSQTYTNVTKVTEFMEQQSNLSFTPGVIAYQQDYLTSLFDDMTKLVNDIPEECRWEIDAYVDSYYSQFISPVTDSTTTSDGPFNQSTVIPDVFSVYSDIALCSALIVELTSPSANSDVGIFGTDWRYFVFFNTYTDTSLLSEVASAFTALSYSSDMDYNNCLTLNSLYPNLPWSQECDPRFSSYYQSLTSEGVITFPRTTVTPPPAYNITETLTGSATSIFTLTTYYPMEIVFEVPMKIFKSPTSTLTRVTTTSADGDTSTHPYTTGEAVLITQTFTSEYTGSKMATTTLGTENSMESIALIQYSTTASITSSLQPLVSCAADALIYYHEQNPKSFESMISSLALSEASSISSAYGGANTVTSRPIAEFTNFMSNMSRLHYSSTSNTQFDGDWSSQSMTMMAHYYNLIFALLPEDKLQLIDFMGNCYLHEFTDTSTTTTSTSTTLYKTLSQFTSSKPTTSTSSSTATSSTATATTTMYGYGLSEPDKVPTSISQMKTTEIVTGHVTSSESDQLSAYRNYNFGDGSFFLECFKFGANLNLISWSIVDTDDSTVLGGVATGSTGDVSTKTKTRTKTKTKTNLVVDETTVSVYPSGLPAVWPTAVEVGFGSVNSIWGTQTGPGADTRSVLVTGSSGSSLSSIQGVDVYTITLAQATSFAPNY